MSWTIRPYMPTDQESWLRCRVLAFLHSAYYDDVHTTKDVYAHPAFEYVAVTPDNQVIGLLDAELDEAPGSAASPGETRGAVIWNIAVHPDWQGGGVAHDLLSHLLPRLASEGIARLEAWTRDDTDVVAWYERQRFRSVEQYYHVYLEGPEHRGLVQSQTPDLHLVRTFAHLTGSRDEIGDHAGRIHVCQRFERPV